MYAVFVTWEDAPKRAERLDAHSGTTTTRRVYASAFPTRADAERAARICLNGIEGVLTWRIAPF